MRGDGREGGGTCLRELDCGRGGEGRLHAEVGGKVASRPLFYYS